MTPTEDQIEAARTKVRNMLHAADHGNEDPARSQDLAPAITAVTSGQSHTPGPWTVGKGEWPHAHSWVVTSAAMPNPGSPLAILQDFDNAAEPDARLIAAAPALLEALWLILPLAKGYRPEGQTATARATCNAWISAAEAALSLAQPYEAEVDKTGE